MRRLLLNTLLFLIVFFLFPQPVLASGFQVKTVGALNVEGITYKQLWYSNGNLTFSGIALQNAQVTAAIDGTGQTVNADSSGNWSFSTTLAGGDHQISFSSGGSTVAFTLTIGEIPADIGSLPTATTPAVGTTAPTFLLLFLGMSLFASPFILRGSF